MSIRFTNIPKIKRLLLLIVLCLPSISIRAQQPCTVGYDDLPGQVQTHLRNRNDRIEDLVELLDEADEVEEADTYELMYWAAMAESAAARAGVAYPDCDTYQALDAAFHQTIDHAYAIAAHSALIQEGRLTDFQAENITAIFQDRLTAAGASIDTWAALYETIQARG